MSSDQLEATHLRAILDLLAATHDAVGAREFATVLMCGLSSLVRCELISYNDIDLTDGHTEVYFEPELVPRPELQEAFALLIDQHPLVRYYADTHDLVPLRMSDRISMLELQQLDLYHEVFRPLETNYQLGFVLAAEPGRVIGVGINRLHSDFTDRDLALMAELQPHLASAFEHAVLRERWAGRLAQSVAAASVFATLTPREREVAELIAEGRSNRRIARTLLISERTAENHTARVLRKLGVASRAEVVAQLMRAPGGPSEGGSTVRRRGT